MSRIGLKRRILDVVAGRAAFAATAFAFVLAVGFGAMLWWKAAPLLESNSAAKLLFSSEWLPAAGKFGFLPFILGTLWVTALSMLIAIPLSFFTAVYLYEYAPRPIERMMRSIVELLAGVPSVVFGVWGVVMIVPLVRSGAAGLAHKSVTGYSVLAGGVVLALMVVPIMVSVMLEVLKGVPAGLKEVSLSLGATRWETVRRVVCKACAPGLVAACILALARAFGETMAVLMVVGNVAVSPRSVLDPAYPLPALIANNYGEMMSVKLYDSALMMAALVLMLVVVASHIAARLIVMRVSKNASTY